MKERSNKTMSRCGQIQSQITFYLDNELQERERAGFEAHLQSCVACREIYEYEKQWLQNVRATRPLYETPETLRAQIEKMLSDTPSPYTAPAKLRRQIHRTLAQKHHAYHVNRRVLGLAALLFILAFLTVWFFSARKTQQHPSKFALMAVDTHQRRLRGQLPLEIASDSPEKISAWFAGKVPFALTLPNYQEASGQDKLYNLEGARLVAFNNDYAAYIGYQMQQRPITLVVTADSVATPSGGEEIISKGLKFHYDSIDGFKVITWSDRGVTYALVSDLEERGQQSCIVCHTGTKDRDFIETLKPTKLKHQDSE